MPAAPTTCGCAACASRCVLESFGPGPWHVQPTACHECPLAEWQGGRGRCRHPHAGPLAEAGALLDIGIVPFGCPLAHTDLLVRGDAVRGILTRDHAIAGERARLRALLDHGGVGVVADDLTEDA